MIDFPRVVYGQIRFLKKKSCILSVRFCTFHKVKKAISPFHFRCLNKKNIGRPSFSLVQSVVFSTLLRPSLLPKEGAKPPIEIVLIQSDLNRGMWQNRLLYFH